MNGGSDGLMVLEVCCGSPIRRNSVLEELTVSQLDDIHEDMRDTVDSKSEIAVGTFFGNERHDELGIICIKEV